MMLKRRVAIEGLKENFLLFSIYRYTHLKNELKLLHESQAPV